MTLKSKTLAALLVALMFGSIFFSSAMGWWQTKGRKNAAVFSGGAFAGRTNPADIRGSYTFGDVERNFGVPAALLAQAFGIETNSPADFQVKTLEAMYAGSPLEIGTSSVRLFVAFYQGLPFDLAEEIYLPEPAAQILRERDLNSAQEAYLETHVIAAEPAAVSSIEPDTTEQDDTEALAGECEQPTTNERLIKGKTSFSDLLVWGLSKETIETVMGVSMPENACQVIKDFCSVNGLEYGPIRQALQAELDALK